MRFLGGFLATSSKGVDHDKSKSDCSSVINMREESDISSSVSERIPTDTIVDVKKRNKEWSCIQFNGKTGYIMNRFLVFGEKDGKD